MFRCVSLSPSVHILCTQIIAFDDLKTDYKNPVDLCNSLNPVNFELLIDKANLFTLLNLNDGTSLSSSLIYRFAY